MKNVIHIPLIVGASLLLALILIVHIHFSFAIVLAQLLGLKVIALFLDECDQETAILYKSVIKFVDHTLEG